MAQYDVLTGLSPRRRVRYADQIRAEAPASRRKYFADRDYRLRQDALDQSQQQFDAEQALLSEEFARQAELQRQQIEAAERQATVSNAISGLGLAKTAYPYAKQGVTGAYDLIAGGGDAAAGYEAGSVAALGPESGVAAAPESVLLAEGASDVAALGPESGLIGSAGVGSGDAAVAALGPESGAAGIGGTEGGAAAGGGGLSWWGGPVIAGVSLAQMGLAGASEPTEGVAPGHFFSQNESGNWRPRFAEPDKNFFSQQWGGGSTTGAKFDARLQKGDWQGAGKALPGFAHGYAIPGLDVAENVLGGYADRQGAGNVAKVAKALADPIGSISSSLAEADDIGDAAVSILTGGIGGGK